VLAIIPARGGSKGIPAKNKRLIAGKPLISYTIEAALQSNGISKIVVSSDDEEIIDIARQYDGIQIHRRESVLATDSSPITDTILDILSQVERIYDAVMLLQPTSPIRTSQQLDEAIALFATHPEANSLISVIPMQDVHPARMYWQQEDCTLKPILQAYEQTRRQDIPTAWYRNGAIYIVKCEAFERYNQVMIPPSIGFAMPASQWLNIDEPRDLLIAEALIPAWKRGKLQ
jgi:CMP-N-acetylneuraminic acid synthetase